MSSKHTMLALLSLTSLPLLAVADPSSNDSLSLFPLHLTSTLPISNTLTFTELHNAHNTTVLCLDCSLNGEIKTTMNIEFAKMPELDAAIEDIQITDEDPLGRHHEIDRPSDTREHSSPPEQQGQHIEFGQIRTYNDYLAWSKIYDDDDGHTLATIIDKIDVELPLRYSVPKQGYIYIPEGGKPFEGMTAAKKEGLRGWRSTGDVLLRKAMVRKGEEMALAGLWEGEGECDLWRALFGKREFVEGVGARDVQRSWGDPFAKFGEWVRDHEPSVIAEVEVTETLTANHNIHIHSQKPLNLAFTWDYRGLGDWSYTAALQLGHAASDTTIFDLRTQISRWSSADDLEAPESFDTRLGTLDLDVVPLSVAFNVLTSQPANVTLPVTRTVIPKGSKLRVDVLKGEILESDVRLQPEVQALKDSETDVDISVAVGTKAQVKLVPRKPGSKPKKPACVAKYTQTLKDLIVGAKNAVPNWLNRNHAPKAGFGDPLTVGLRFDWARWDLSVHKTSNVDGQCNRSGPLESALEMIAVFRQGFTPYLNWSFWAADTTVFEKGEDAAAGVFETWEVMRVCVEECEAKAGFEEMRNVSAGIGNLTEGAEAGWTGNERNPMASRLWVEEMAMGANDTARMLAKELGVELGELGFEEWTDVEYEVRGE